MAGKRKLVKRKVSKRLSIALYSGRSNLSLLDVNQTKAISVFFKLRSDFEQFFQKRNCESLKTNKFKANNSFKEKINSI